MNPSSIDQWTENVTKIGQKSFDMGMKNLEILQDQASKVIEFASTSAGRIQDTMHVAFNDWVKSANQVSRRQTEALQNGFDMLSTAFSVENAKLKQPKKEEK